MTHTYHLTRVSNNKKCGPIPVSTSSKSTCPTCPLKSNGCYAEGGPLRLHWDKVSDGTRGVDLEQFCNEVRALPKRQLWRWTQAGDLPGDHDLIDEVALQQLVQANRGRRGFGFTHYDPGRGDNGVAVLMANTNGFTMNLSANNLEHADELLAHDVGPVVVVLPSDATKPLRTPAGNFVAICPATQRDDVTCATCGICAHPTRKAIIGFPAHGAAKKKAQSIFYARVERTMTADYDIVG